MSVVEDICSTSTQGMWVMPKHTVLGMTVCHLNRPTASGKGSNVADECVALLVALISTSL